MGGLARAVVCPGIGQIGCREGWPVRSVAVPGPFGVLLLLEPLWTWMPFGRCRHGLKLVIKEDVMPQEQMPHFPALEKLAANGFLSVETWNNKRAMLNFKATAEVPMLGI